MERDQTRVMIRLDRQRGYRVRDEDRRAIWVGPGKVTVPKWVAEAWGATILKTLGPAAEAVPTEPTPPPSPIDDDDEEDELSREADDADGEEEDGADAKAMAPPHPEYDTWNADQVIHFGETLNDEGRAAVVAYERAHKNRKTVIEELE